MRVLLPFLKSGEKRSAESGKQSQGNVSKETQVESEPVQDSTCSSSEEAEPSPIATDEPLPVENSIEEPLQRAAPLKDPPAASSEPQPIKEQGPFKTTGLPAVPPKNQCRTSSTVSRKRPRPESIPEEARKPPALERKPAPKPSPNSKTMGLPPQSRSQAASDWLYQHQSHGGVGTSLVTTSSIDEDPALIENTPAEASSNVASRVQPVGDNESPFDSALKKRGFEIQEQEGDGNCLFRAVSLQVYGDASMHIQVRKQCLDFMEKDQEHFAQFVTDESFPDYIKRKRQEGVHGNNPEIQAISELFNRPIEVFSPEGGATPLNIFHAEYKTDDAPIRLSYHDGNHYNAVIDPLVPTAGLGLGLPGLQPGLADKMQVAKAVVESDAAADQMALKKVLKESEDDELQRALKESTLSTEHMRSHEAMALSDMDATYFELEQAALERSLRELEHEKKIQARSRTSGGGPADQAKIASSKQPGKTLSSKPSSTPFSNSGPAAVPGNQSNALSEEKMQSISVPAVASRPPSTAAAYASVSEKDDPETEEETFRSVTRNPPVVDELVLNGFERKKVIRAVELIGENFDDLLPFLMANTS